MYKMYLKKIFNISVVGIIIMAVVSVFLSEGIGRLSLNPYVHETILQEILRYNSDDYIKHISIYNAYNMFNHMIAFTSLYMILPLLSAPFIISFCDAENNGFEKMILYRVGQKNFTVKTLISCIASCYVLAFAVNIILFLIAIFIFPQGDFSTSEYIWHFLRKWMLTGTLLTGYTGISLLVAVFTRNKFISIIFSVFLMEIIQIGLTRNHELLVVFQSPSTYLSLYGNEHIEIRMINLILPVVVIAVEFIACYFGMMKRRVYGD